jgi:hypothetical protein
METMTVRQGSSDDRIDVLERKVVEGFHHVDGRFAAVDHRFELVDQRFEQVDQRFEQVDKRFEQVDKRFEQMDQRFEQVDKRFEGVERRMENGFKELRTEMKGGFDRIDTRLDAFQRTLILFCGGMMAALIGLIGTQL